MLSRTGWMSEESLRYISALVMLNWNLSHTEPTSLASRDSSSSTLGLRLADWNLGLDFIVFRTLARSSNKSFSTFSCTERILLLLKYVNCKWVNAKCKIWIVLMSFPDRKWSNHKEQEGSSTPRPDPWPIPLLLVSPLTWTVEAHRSDSVTCAMSEICSCHWKWKYN